MREGSTPSFKLALAAALLLLPAKALQAITISSDSDPGIAGEGFIRYSGYFGETFKLRGGWKIDASAHARTETIRIYPPFNMMLPDSAESFSPGDSLFEPDNFTPYALIELVISARTSSPTTLLSELKAKKIRELDAEGARYQLIENPPISGLGNSWPPGTFEILVDAPYQLTQLYTATALQTCILTSGRDTPPSSVISSHYEPVRLSLAYWVNANADAPNLPAPTSRKLVGLAAEVVARLKNTAQFQELQAQFLRRNAADPSWSASNEGQAISSRIQRMYDDAASVRIEKGPPRRGLVYSIGGKEIFDAGILVGDLESDKSYRNFIAQGVANAIAEQFSTRPSPPRPSPRLPVAGTMRAKQRVEAITEALSSASAIGPAEWRDEK